MVGCLWDEGKEVHVLTQACLQHRRCFHERSQSSCHKIAALQQQLHGWHERKIGFLRDELQQQEKPTGGKIHVSENVRIVTANSSTPRRK